jgi:hypothetical protein
MNAIRTPDLATLLFALTLCAVFGGLFAWVLSVPFWLGFAMVGAALFALGVQSHHERSTPRRRLHARASH